MLYKYVLLKTYGTNRFTDDGRGMAEMGMKPRSLLATENKVKHLHL